MKKPNSINPGRRNALKALGIASAATVAQPILAGLSGSLGSTVKASSILGTRASLRVAVLLPSSPMNAVAISFNDGFNLAIAASASRVTARVHDIGQGVNRAIAFARAQAERRDADVAVGLMSTRVAQWMDHDLASARLPLLVANAGERFGASDKIGSQIAVNTLDLTASAYAAGRWSARNIARECVVAASFYETGFDMMHAFRAGYEAEGGRVTATLISGSPSSPATALDVVHTIAQGNTPMAAAFYSGDEATEFFGAYGSLERTANIPVVGSPLVTAAQAPGIEILSGATWASSLANEANKEFVAAFTKRHGRVPDAFAMLGYESARLVLDASQRTGTNGDTLLAALRSSRYQSVRGELVANASSNQISAPMYTRRVTRRGTEELAAELAPAGSLMKQISTLPERHGWIGSYLTV